MRSYASLSPIHASTPAPKGGAAVFVALPIFLFWATLYLSWPGYTLHTVDNVRDYRVALDIASGADWPLASQPFAGRWQLPPLYFHLLALPLRIWPHEQMVFLFSGLFAAGAIATLAASMARREGWGAAAVYGALAAPPHSAVVFPGVSNSALAFSFVTLMLAAWFQLRTRPAVAMPIMLVMAWCAVLMHPSAVVIVVPACIAAGVLARTAWRQRATWAAALLLAVATVGWVSLHGIVAPEAVTGAPDSFDSAAAIARLFSASHWAALWGTPWTHMLELRDLRAMLSPAPILAGAGALVIGLALAVIYGSTQAHRELRLLLLATAASALFATAILSAWGFWYLDSLWPAFAALSACGWSRLANQFRIAGYALAVPAMVAAISLPLLIKETAVRTERYNVGLRGMFLPVDNSHTEAINIPLASALIRYRTFVAHDGGCASSRFVGLDELWLRDLTLRFTIADCARSPVGQPHDPRYLVTTGEPADSIAVQRQFGDVKLLALPSARIAVNGAQVGETQSWSPGRRYSYYEPASLAPGAEIRVEQTLHSTQPPGASAAATRPHLFVVFRCLDAQRSDIEAALESRTPLALNRQRELAQFRYFEFMAPLNEAGNASIATKTALKCDISAWLGVAKP